MPAAKQKAPRHQTVVTTSVTTLDKRHRRNRKHAARFREGCFPDAILKVERARFPRAVSQTAPGRLRASFTPVLRPVREVLSLDWDRRRRVTPAGSASQEAWPGVEPVGLRASGKRRGRSAERRAVPAGIASAPAALSDGNVCECGADNGWIAPVGAPPPFLFGRQAFVPFVKQNSDAIASRERDHFSVPAIAGEEGRR
jgi:hypothetical protein